jgi:amidase
MLEGKLLELSFAPARKIASLVKSNKLSALEVTDHFISRIGSFDTALKAIAVPDFDRARARAKQLDRRRRQSSDNLPPLFGVPMTVKESFDVAGLPTSWGSQRFRNNIVNADAVAVARLKQAGAIILGKTNISALLADWQSSNPIYGTTSNPWDLTRTPGGSSGGSAAALAAGLSALEAGSDIGGSLRAPAHYCGIYAHKPTWEICPQRGHSLHGDLAPVDIAVVGPMARSAGDLAIALDVMAGGDIILGSWQLNLVRPKFKSLKDLRVAIMPDHEICPVDAEISNALHELGKHLRDEGAKVSLTARPDFEAREAHENYLLMLNAALSPRMSVEERSELRRRVDAAAIGDRSLGLVAARGAVMDHLEWLRAREDRARKRIAWAEFFKNYDVFITPIASTAAVTHELSHDMSARTITVNGAEITVADQLFWPGYSGNFLLPSTAAPLGMTKSGLPYGMQIIGTPYADFTTIAVAALLEKSWLGFQPPPGYLP